MKIIIKILMKFYYPLFVISQKKYNDNLNKLKSEDFINNSIIGKNTRVFDEARIYNNLFDKMKIIIGDNCDIRGELMIYGHGGLITIGDYSFVGGGTKIWSAKKIKIGNRVLISHNVNIHDNNSHPIDSISRHKDFIHIKTIGLQKSINLNEKEIIIEDDVWIGFNSTILKGVTIGKGAIIGANTLVNRDIPPFAVCVGNPLKIIKYAK